MRTQTKEIQQNLTPVDVHRILVEGNKRFVQNVKAQRDLKSQVVATSTGQFPFAVILSCIDSRVPAELVFDQGIGDIFSIQVQFVYTVKMDQNGGVCYPGWMNSLRKRKKQPE